MNKDELELKTNRQKGIVKGYTKTLSRRQLAYYYYAFGVKESCRQLGITFETFYDLLDSAKIKRIGKGNAKRLKYILSDVPIEEQFKENGKRKEFKRKEKKEKKEVVPDLKIKLKPVDDFNSFPDSTIEKLRRNCDNRFDTKIDRGTKEKS